MTHTTIGDVMTRDVATVGSVARFRDIAGVLETWQVSALPVVDDGHRVLGIVSEADLLHARVADAETARVGPEAYREPDLEPLGEEFTARDLMTAPVITVTPTSSTLRAARLMDRHHVKRLPVVDRSGRLVGIVSRCDLLGALLRSDAEIRAEIEQDVLSKALCLEPGTVEVEVRDAVVHLAGEVDHPTLVDIVLRLCAAVDGVEKVSHGLIHPSDSEDPALAPTSGRIAKGWGEGHTR
ncbi:CBS domain-containing protein [Embleya sp. NPDC005575]|uniref:CBS domain-containing protein n=1 Tax=Embleya sp. NPDC005575 TaxID=3156892 RepID=UPI0033AE052F